MTGRSLAVAGREQDLVEVGELQLAALELPDARPCPARRGRRARRRSAGPRSAGGRAPSRRIAASAAGRSLRHSASGSAATSSLVRPVFTDRGAPRGPSPAGRARRSCGAAATAPCRRRLLCPRRTSTKRPASFSPWRSKCSSPFSMAASRVVGAGRLPRAPVPDDHVAAAVLALGDDALEVEVLDRVVLDVHREPPRLRVERRPLRHRPAGQHAVDLEPEVVVQAAGPVALHDEPATVALDRPARPARP